VIRGHNRGTLGSSVGVFIAVAAAFAAFGCPVARASTFTVTSTADAPDADPGNGSCASSLGQCTVRAAVDETNALASADEIRIPPGTYPINSRIAIEDDVSISGEASNTTVLDGGNSAPLVRAEANELLVCDGAANSVRRFDRYGGARGTFVAPGSGGLNLAQSVREGPDGDVFVAGYLSGVHRYDAISGAHEGLLVPIGSAGLTAPTDAAFAPWGELYVTKYPPPGSGILRYDGTGAPLPPAPLVPEGRGGLLTPNSVAFRNGDLFVTSAGSNAVLRFNAATGALISQFVPPFSGGLSRPRDLIFRGSSLYVVSEANDQVLRYNADTGAYQGPFVTSGSGGLDRPTDIDFGPDGDLYVVSAATRQVLRYDGTTGAPRGVFVQGATTQMGRPACLTWRTRRDGPRVSISRISLANGETALADAGAGLLVGRGADVLLADSIVRDNRSSVYGGGISNFGRLTLRRTEVLGNELPIGGGGVTSTGGGVFNATTGVLTLDKATLAGNSATRGGGVTNQGGQARLINSTISGNRAAGGGGGIRNVGTTASLSLTASTVTDNEVNAPGSGAEPSRVGGGLFNASGGRISLGDTVLAGNRDNRSRSEPEYAPDCWSEDPLSSQRGNLIGVVNVNCSLRDPVATTTPFDQTGSNVAALAPGLGPLGNNGGVTRTHLPLGSSPAVDSATYSNCPGDDQRGKPRPVDGNADGNARCDVGAIERQMGE
jgi:CSLREA domain-containing protein